MLISFRKRFIFVANTKTASTAIEAALMPHADITHPPHPAKKHMAITKIFHEYAPAFHASRMCINDFFIFGVMREPIDWITSWFRYRQGNNVESPLPPDMSFAEFWQAADWNIWREDGRKYLQRDLFCSANGDNHIDAILPYEDIERAFPNLCAKLGIETSLSRINESNIKNLNNPISPELTQALRQHYAPDYALRDAIAQINTTGAKKLAARKG